jgi:hypothetical protein
MTKSKSNGPIEQGTHSSGKDNSECASLRIGNLPQAEEVKAIDPNANPKAAVSAVEKQNCSDGKGKEGLNVLPVGRNNPTTTSSGN